VNDAEFQQWRRDYQTHLEITTVERPRVLVMGILNVTPNSFSDGGSFFSVPLAIARVDAMLMDGVDLIDVGGEASNPGALPISADEELARIIPIIQAIRAKSDVVISVDTVKPLVMQAAIEAGASMINDIKALTTKGAMAVLAAYSVPVCLMHMQGTPEMMQQNPQYNNVQQDVSVFLAERVSSALAAGISRDRLLVDPGFGFGKTVQHNLMLLKHLSVFACHGVPILLGVSRKSTIASVVGLTSSTRLPGSLAAAVYAVLQGVSIVRVHDVAETVQAIKMTEAILKVEHYERA